MIPTRKYAALLTFLLPGAVFYGVRYGPLPTWTIPASWVGWFVLIGAAMVYANVVRPLESPAYVVLPDGAETTAGSDEWARAVADQLGPHGFVARARYCLPGPNALDFARRFDNPSTGEVAAIMAGWQQLPNGRVRPIRCVVFYTCFRDGGELVTSNSPLSSMTPKLPRQAVYRLPGVTDATTLYSLHRRLVKGDGRKPKPIALSDDPLVWELELNRREIATQVALGLGVRDAKAGVLRLTFKGALRNSVLLHPWLTAFQDWRAARAAATALQSVPA